MVERRDVTFTSDGLRLAGHLYVPERAGSASRLPAVVLSGPFTGVKEQVTGTYARRLADHGFVALAFDHRNFGASEGTPRQHEDAAGKLADLADAVAFLRTLPEVDRDRLGACGVCLGTSYVLKFAAFDPRVRALALVAGAYNDPTVMRAGMGNEGYRMLLADAAEARQRRFESGEVEYLPAVAPEGPAAMPGPEPFAYYGTDRAASPGWRNRVSTLSIATLVTLDAASAADFVSPTPLLMVHGETDAYCSPEAAASTYARVGEPKRLVWLPTTNHIDLYDLDPFVRPAVDEVTRWFQTHV